MKAIETLSSSTRRCLFRTAPGHAKSMCKCLKSSRCSRRRWRPSRRTSSSGPLWPATCTTRRIRQKSSPLVLRIQFLQRSTLRGKYRSQKERTFGDPRKTMEILQLQPQTKIWLQRSSLPSSSSNSLRSTRSSTKCSKTISTMTATGIHVGPLAMTST